MGRKRDTNELQDLQIARMSIVDGLSYSAIAERLSLGTKNTACLRVAEVRKNYPELIQRFEEIERYTPEVAAIAEERTLELDEHLRSKDLADQIEMTIKQLLDISPQDIRAMKTEHRLRNVDPLIKAMRLLRDESTQNVKQVSLIGAIGIATARRKPTESGD